MKKIVSSVLLALTLLTSQALAEAEGVFIGANAGYGKLAWGEYKAKAYRFGIIAGFKHVFIPELGMRYYLNLDTGSKYTTGNTGPKGAQTQRMGLGVNADLFYNFIITAESAYGAFAGVSLEYGFSKYKTRLASQDTMGLDVGVNLGLRGTFTETHSVELFSRLGRTGPLPKNSEDKITTPMHIGLRYIFTF